MISILKPHVKFLLTYLGNAHVSPSAHIVGLQLQRPLVCANGLCTMTAVGQRGA